MSVNDENIIIKRLCSMCLRVNIIPDFGDDHPNQDELSYLIQCQICFKFLHKKCCNFVYVFICKKCV